MSHQPARRSFLKGRFSRPVVMRPPGAVTEGEFADTCTKCDNCITACPEAIVFRDDEGFPRVDLTKGACTFCGICAQVCTPEAILPTKAWAWRATPKATCLSIQGITCRTCEDQCEQQAIRFRLQTGGRSEPLFDNDLCIGCGACSAACPAGAIDFVQTAPIPSEETRC